MNKNPPKPAKVAKAPTRSSKKTATASQPAAETRSPDLAEVRQQIQARLEAEGLFETNELVRLR